MNNWKWGYIVHPKSLISILKILYSNHCLKEGYLIHSQDRVSRYTLTKKAIKVVKAFRQSSN